MELAKNLLFQEQISNYEIETFMKKYLIRNKIPFTQIHDSFNIESKYEKELMEAVIEFKTNFKNKKLLLVKASLTNEYRKKWNVHETDFVYLYKDGKQLSPTLYRVGGFGIKLEEKYSLILKHVEAYYNDNITPDKDKKRHLGSQWCIIDAEGKEKVNFTQFTSPYLSGGVIYSLSNSYYNIETGECYCTSVHSVISSTNYLFIDNKYDKNKAKRGVMQINKNTGTWKIIK